MLFEDETDLLLFPPLRAAWALRGQTATVPLAGGNAKRVIFGTLNVGTGHRLFLPQLQQRGENFRLFLEFVAWSYRGWHVGLVLDEDPCHTAGRSQQEAANRGIALHWLPKRCPHLNPVDHLWRHGKQVVCANRQHTSIEQQTDAFLTYLDSLSPHEALHKAGVLSEDFWLHI